MVDSRVLVIVNKTILETQYNINNYVIKIMKLCSDTERLVRILAQYFGPRCLLARYIDRNGLLLNTDETRLNRALLIICLL